MGPPGRRSAEQLETPPLQFDVANQAGDDLAMAHTVSEIRRIEGEDGALWRYGRARLLIRRAHPPKPSASGESTPLPEGALRLLVEASRLLDQAAEHRPSWPRIAMAKAEIDDLRGNPESALDQYLRAIDLGDRNVGTIGRAVAILYKRGRFTQADQVLHKLQEGQERMPLSPDLQHLAVDVSMRVHNYERALSLALKTIPEDSTKYADQIWLGQILWGRSPAGRHRWAGRRGQAAASRRRACPEASHRAGRRAAGGLGLPWSSSWH